MLLSPISLPEATARRPAAALAPFPAPVRSGLGSVLRAWLALGVATLLCVPATRGNALLGATVPFWLVAAPAIGLAWLARERVLGWTMRAASPRVVRRQAYRSSASRRCRAERSSR